MRGRDRFLFFTLALLEKRQQGKSAVAAGIGGVMIPDMGRDYLIAKVGGCWAVVVGGPAEIRAVSNPTLTPKEG